MDDTLEMHSVRSCYEQKIKPVSEVQTGNECVHIVLPASKTPAPPALDRRESREITEHGRWFIIIVTTRTRSDVSGSLRCSMTAGLKD